MKKINIKNINFDTLQKEVNNIKTDIKFWNEQEQFFEDETAKRKKDIKKHNISFCKFKKRFSI